ncbi:hypothetical protein [Acinetobacter baumannii]|uniref:hypothetical protein n=1 Tax=Acinetobacter baumannii TaxID=470 RepID=UPI003858E444
MSAEVIYNVYFENEQGIVLINTLTLKQIEALERYKDGENRELSFNNSKVKLVDDGKSLVLIIASSSKIKVSKQNLENYYSLLLDVISNIEDAVSKVKGDTRRILHNIVGLNSFNTQEFDSIFSPEQLDGLSQRKMLHYMSEEIKKNSNKVARSILKMSKNNYEIKYELEVFKYLFNPNSVLRKSKQNIHRVTKRILDTFFLDFLDKEIFVNLYTRNDDIIECELNFDCLRYAIYNIFHNALKYCKRDSNIDVHIYKEDNIVYIDFNMISLAVKKHEVDKIFIEGYCGEYARNSFSNGEGIGLYMTKNMLNRINSEIRLFQKEEYNFNSTLYQRNIFQIEICL